MNSSIHCRRIISKERQDKLVEFCDTSNHNHVFQSFSWEKMHPERKYLHFWHENDNKIDLYALIETEKQKPFLNAFIGTIRCGPIFNKISVFRENLTQMLSFLRGKNCISIRMNPFWLNQEATIIEQIIVEANGKCVQTPSDYHYVSTIINLSESEEDIYRKFKKSSTQQMIKKAQKIPEVTIRFAQREDIPAIAHMFSTMFRDKNVFNYYNEQYFRNVYHEIIEDGRGFCKVQEYNDEIISMAISFICGNTCIYTHGASSTKYRDVPKSHLLNWEMIKHARHLGLSFYDMGGINPDVTLESDRALYGITRFKYGFSNKLITNCRVYQIILSPLKYIVYDTLKKLYHRYIKFHTI